METFICMLRGINVSGHKIIKMESLRNTFRNLEFQNINTYIQSGNIVFNSNETNQVELEHLIAKAIHKDFTYEVPVMVKSASQLQNVVKNNPFGNKFLEDLSKMAVTFLSKPPQEDLISKIREIDHGSGEYEIMGTEVYLYCPEGLGNTKLSTNFFENKLKVSGTARNWRTINKLIEMAQNN